MIDNHDIVRAEELLAILKREHAALLAGDLEALDQVVRAKRAAAAHFEQLVRALAGGGTVAAAGPGARLAELAAECRRQNEINGGIVESGLRHVRSVIGLLRGGQGNADLYTRHGEHTTASGALRPLAKA